MAEPNAQLLYLEPDDEITSVVRRLRESDAARVVLVASGRSKATSSSIGLRLLAQVAAEGGRQIAVVADPAARALAAEAGIDAFASVADASAESPAPEEPQPVRRAAIRVVRDLPERLGDAEPAAAAPRPGPSDETEVVAVSRPEAPAHGVRGSSRGPRTRRTVFGAGAAIILLTLAGMAAVLPGATVTIVPATSTIGPRAYDVEPPVEGPDTATLRSTKQGTASGERIETIPATGTVTLFNWNGPNTPVEVPAGTVVSGGGATFTTDATVVVPGGHFAGGPIESGEADVAVTAIDGGTAGNVAARAIDTVETAAVANQLTGPFQILPIVRNTNATSGGDEQRHVVVEQADVDAVVAAIHADLREQVAARLAADAERVYPSIAFEPPLVDVPGDLVGMEDEPSFELSAAYVFSRSYVRADEVDTAAREAFEADDAAIPDGMVALPETLVVEVGDARQVQGGITVTVSVTASAATEIDVDAAKARILGQTPEEARQTLGDLGTVSVDLWPGWVDRIPRLDWRVSIEVSAE